jgi:hypothetical protein
MPLRLLPNSKDSFLQHNKKGNGATAAVPFFVPAHAGCRYIVQSIISMPLKLRHLLLTSCCQQVPHAAFPRKGAGGKGHFIFPATRKSVV